MDSARKLIAPSVGSESGTLSATYEQRPPPAKHLSPIRASLDKLEVGDDGSSDD